MFYIKFGRIILEDLNKDFELLRDKAEKLKAVAHPVRLCILRGLIRKGNCDVSFIKECLNIPQSTVSQNIQVLRHADIIEGRREGSHIYYSVVDDTVKEILKILFEDDKEKSE